MCFPVCCFSLRKNIGTCSPEGAYDLAVKAEASYAARGSHFAKMDEPKDNVHKIKDLWNQAQSIKDPNCKAEAYFRSGRWKIIQVRALVDESAVSKYQYDDRTKIRNQLKARIIQDGLRMLDTAVRNGYKDRAATASNYSLAEMLHCYDIEGIKYYANKQLRELEQDTAKEAQRQVEYEAKRPEREREMQERAARDQADETNRLLKEIAFNTRYYH